MHRGVIGILAIAIIGSIAFAAGESRILSDVEVIGKGFQSGYTEAANLVIKDEEEWKAIWEKVATPTLPKPEIPKVDFEKNMLIAVFMGQKSTGGYSVEVVGVEYRSDEVVVHIKETSPKPGAIVTQSLTQPFFIVQVPRSELPVRFEK
ncbi:MAG: protease complex subunit PrcB family protein [bacterium]